MLSLMLYDGAPCGPETISRGSHGVPQMPLKGFSAITWREANPAFVDLGVDTEMSTEIGNNLNIKVLWAFTRRLAETPGFEPGEPP